MPKKVLKGNVRTLLKKKSNVMEDFRANTSSYKRQMNAIRSLKSEEYSARNLKDILLNVEEPEEKPTIFEPKYLGSNIVGFSSGSSTFNKISFKFRAEYSSLFNDLIAFI